MNNKLQALRKQVPKKQDKNVKLRDFNQDGQRQTSNFCVSQCITTITSFTVRSHKPFCTLSVGFSYQRILPFFSIGFHPFNIGSAF